MTRRNQLFLPVVRPLPHTTVTCGQNLPIKKVDPQSFENFLCKTCVNTWRVLHLNIEDAERHVDLSKASSTVMNSREPFANVRLP